jgi:hypothetical protein
MEQRGAKHLPSCAPSSAIENELLAGGSQTRDHLIDLRHGQKKTSPQACKETRDFKTLVVKKESSREEEGSC